MLRKLAANTTRCVTRRPLSSKPVFKTVSGIPALPAGSFVSNVNLTPKLAALLKFADENKTTYIQKSTLDSSSVVNWLNLKFVHSSNALEGNNLSQKEVYRVIREGVTIGGKPLQDIRDVVAYDKAVQLIFSASYLKQPIDAEMIKQMHRVGLPVLETAGIPGEYKKSNNFTFTELADGTPALRFYVEHEDVRDRVAELMFWLRDNESKVHPIILSAVGHYNLVTIHPFVDGNGRVARLLMNALLVRHSFTPAIIEPFQKDEYVKAIESVRESDDITLFVEFIAQTVIDTQKELLELNSFSRKLGK